MNFSDLASPEFYKKLLGLAKEKENHIEEKVEEKVEPPPLPDWSDLFSDGSKEPEKVDDVHDVRTGRSLFEIIGEPMNLSRPIRPLIMEIGRVDFQSGSTWINEEIFEGQDNLPMDIFKKNVEEFRAKHPDLSDCLDIMYKTAYEGDEDGTDTT